MRISICTASAIQGGANTLPATQFTLLLMIICAVIKKNNIQ